MCKGIVKLVCRLKYSVKQATSVHAGLFPMWSCVNKGWCCNNFGIELVAKRCGHWPLPLQHSTNPKRSQRLLCTITATTDCGTIANTARNARCARCAQCDGPELDQRADLKECDGTGTQTAVIALYRQVELRLRKRRQRFGCFGGTLQAQSKDQVCRQSD